MATVSYTPNFYQLDAINSGDTFLAVNFVRTDTPPAILSSVSWKVYPAGSETASLTKTNGDGITINDAATWDMDIDEFAVALPAGQYWYKIVCTDADGVIGTEWAGTWRIR